MGFFDFSATFTPTKNNNRRWESEWVFGVYNAYARRNAASVSFIQDFNTGENEARRISVFGSFIPSITYNFKF